MRAISSRFCADDATERNGFELLAERLPDIQLVGDVKRLRSCFINGIKEMAEGKG